MLKIQEGRAKDSQSKYWFIEDDQGKILTEYNSKKFKLDPDTKVYFIDLNLEPSRCENVQSKAEVDGYLQTATPSGGKIATDVDTPLRLYVMAALLNALERQGTARSAYLAKLHDKMAKLAQGAKAGKVTLAQLKEAGIAD